MLNRRRRVLAALEGVSMAYKGADHSELRELQLAELDLMRLFVRICKKYGLRYYMIGGTMLGAVRHKGFIPWDDDMDVGMPRPDYEKFMEIVHSELPEGYDFHDYRRTQDYLRGFSKIVNTKVLVTNASYAQETVQFAWLDIFPLDGMPKNRLLRAIHSWYLVAWRFFYHASCSNTNLNLCRPGRPRYQQFLIKFIEKTKLGTKLDSKKLLRHMEKDLLKCPYDSSEYVISMFGAYVLKELMPKAYFGKGAAYPYEDDEFCGPELYDEFLKCLYGDYMTPPKEEHRHEHNIVKVERVA